MDKIRNSIRKFFRGPVEEKKATAAKDQKIKNPIKRIFYHLRTLKYRRDIAKNEGKRKPLKTRMKVLGKPFSKIGRKFRQIFGRQPKKASPFSPLSPENKIRINPSDNVHFCEWAKTAKIKGSDAGPAVKYEEITEIEVTLKSKDDLAILGRFLDHLKSLRKITVKFPEQISEDRKKEILDDNEGLDKLKGKLAKIADKKIILEDEPPVSKVETHSSLEDEPPVSKVEADSPLEEEQNETEDIDAMLVEVLGVADKADLAKVEEARCSFDNSRQIDQFVKAAKGEKFPSLKSVKIDVSPEFEGPSNRKLKDAVAKLMEVLSDKNVIISRRKLTEKVTRRLLKGSDAKNLNEVKKTKILISNGSEFQKLEALLEENTMPNLMELEIEVDEYLKPDTLGWSDLCEQIRKIKDFKELKFGPRLTPFYDGIQDDFEDIAFDLTFYPRSPEEMVDAEEKFPTIGVLRLLSAKEVEKVIDESNQLEKFISLSLNFEGFRGEVTPDEVARLIAKLSESDHLKQVIVDGSVLSKCSIDNQEKIKIIIEESPKAELAGS